MPQGKVQVPDLGVMLGVMSLLSLYKGQSHISAQMGNCVDSLFSMDFSRQKATKKRGIN